MSWLWWAPFGSAVLHIGEEFVYPGGFASWDREYRVSIRGSITGGLHLMVNALLLAACVVVGISGMPGGAILVGGVRIRSAVPASLSVIGWLALAALLFSNAVFHLVGTCRTKWISVFGYWYFMRTHQVSGVAAGAAALLGGSYHLWASLAHRWRARRGR